MTDTLNTHAVAIARTFGTDSAAIAARVTVLYAAHGDGITGGKSIAALAEAATDARIAAAYPGLSRGEFGQYRTDDRYRVGKSTLAMYSLAADVIRGMGLAPSDLGDAAVHAVFRTTANKAGVKPFRDDAAATVLAAPATERPGLVWSAFDAAYTAYRESMRKPAPGTGPDAVEDRGTDATDAAAVERTITAADAAAVPQSADVMVAALARIATDAATLSDADALRVFDALDAVYAVVAPAVERATGAPVTV